jgi:hypothetical protein
MELCGVQWLANALGLTAFLQDQIFTGSDLYRISFVRNQVNGALSYAAVPRVGLGPTPPP